LSKLPFEVFPYNLDHLVTLIAEGSHHQSKDEIRAKRHTEYFDHYLKKLEAKTLLVERNYIDRDFLEDYAAYYVRCFPEYRKTCIRIHVFREEFTKDAIQACLSGDETHLKVGDLKGAYLGFLVIKPLPQTVIGRTCLTTYSDNKTRHFPATREFEANLYGIRLGVVKTLPFQEQDSVVAACATSALWTLFQATSREFQHQLLTPIEITRAATHLLPTESRVIPNQGLSTHMMAHAIKSVNLEPFLIRVAEGKVLHAAIYSYVHARIPLILGIDLVEHVSGVRYARMGKHALAIVGYNLGGLPTPLSMSGLVLRSSRIDKIYVHDDQIGPFARMELDRKRVEVEYPGLPVREYDSLSTSWFPDHGAGDVRAVPDILLVPLYHKVRLTWEWALKRVTEFNEALVQFTKVVPALKLHNLEWDVYLTTVNEVREELRQTPNIAAAARFSAVTWPMPRFIWRATALRDDVPVIDVLYDATDIDTARGLAQVVFHDLLMRDFIKNMADASSIDSLPFKTTVKNILWWVKDNP
jgi:hypothetical protein